MAERESLLLDARKRIAFLAPLAESLGHHDPNYGQLVQDAALVSERVETLEAILRELLGGYADFYTANDKHRLLNVESLVRGLFPPLGDA